MAGTWKALKGIKYNFLPHSYGSSIPRYKDVHTHLNAHYGSQVDGPSFDDIFTDNTRSDLQSNCAAMIKDAIFAIVFERAAPMTELNHLKALITGFKKNLVMNFMVGTTKTFVPSSAGEAIGKGHIQDLFNHTVDTGRNTSS